MWGSKSWGQMVWGETGGGETAVPSMDPTALMLLAIVLIGTAFLVRREGGERWATWLGGAVVLLVPMVRMIQVASSFLLPSAGS